MTVEQAEFMEQYINGGCKMEKKKTNERTKQSGWIHVTLSCKISGILNTFVRIVLIFLLIS